MHYSHGDPYFYTLFVMCIVLTLLGFLVIYSFCFVWVMKVTLQFTVQIDENRRGEQNRSSFVLPILKKMRLLKLTHYN